MVVTELKDESERSEGCREVLSEAATFISA